MTDFFNFARFTHHATMLYFWLEVKARETSPKNVDHANTRAHAEFRAMDDMLKEWAGGNMTPPAFDDLDAALVVGKYQGKELYRFPPRFTAETPLEDIGGVPPKTRAWSPRRRPARLG